jgi:DeoR family transcriptional regulator of aga operon
MMEIAKFAVAVCDSSKFGKRSLSFIGPPTVVHYVITDRGISKADLRALKKAGVGVTIG